MFDWFSDYSAMLQTYASLLPSWYWLSICGLLGLLVGSFLNVVILRLPPRLEFEWRSIAAEYLENDLPPDFKLGDRPPGLVMERSHCPGCGMQLKAIHNIPLISYLALRGRCAGCKRPISMQYPLVEAVTMGLSMLCFLSFGPSLQCFFALLFTWMLVAMSGIDLRTKLLPDELTQPLLWLGLLISLIPVYVQATDALLGAAIGWGSLAGLNAAYKKIRGRDGMGGGDFVLLGALGAWCGVLSLPLIVLLSASVGALVFLGMMIARRYNAETSMPFGPFLAAAGWLQLVFGNYIHAGFYGMLGTY